jgi:hypothetical protein
MDKQVKAGDKVKATDKASGWPDITPGNVYEVHSVIGDTVRIRDDASDLNVLTKDEYELVSEPESAVTAKAGDIITPIEESSGFTPGKEYRVKANDNDNGCEFLDIEEDDAGEWRYRAAAGFTIVRRAEELVEQPQDIYLISGFSSEFPTLEAAEQRLTDGYGLHGEEYRIAKLVKTVRVQRVTTTTLEAV